MVLRADAIHGVPPARPDGDEAGTTVIEVAFVAGLIATLSAAAIPSLLTGIDDLRTSGAARYVATRLQRIRMEAVMRSAAVGVRFSSVGGSYEYSIFADGNGNGVLSRDIQRGIDVPIVPEERLSNHFAGVDFGVTPEVPPVEVGGAPAGTDPIRVGSGSIVTFSTTGTASSGSLYVRGSRGAQYVVRIYGETGRTRVLKFNARSGQWQSP